MVAVLYFAACRARTNIEREQCDALVGLSVADAKAHLCTLHPSLSEIIEDCRVAIDHAFVTDDVTVTEGAEFALIPPVAGG